MDMLERCTQYVIKGVIEKGGPHLETLNTIVTLPKAPYPMIEYPGCSSVEMVSS